MGVRRAAVVGVVFGVLMVAVAPGPVPRPAAPGGFPPGLHLPGRIGLAATTAPLPAPVAAAAQDVAPEADWITTAQVAGCSGTPSDGAIAEVPFSPGDGALQVVDPYRANYAAMGLLAAGSAYYPKVIRWVDWYFAHLNLSGDALGQSATIYYYLEDPANCTEEATTFGPAVLSVSTGPAGARTGPTGGGTSVAIFGNGFVPGTTVFFGGVPSPSDSYLTPELILATSPPGAGIVDVTVQVPAGPVSAVAPSDLYGYGISPTGPFPQAVAYDSQDSWAATFLTLLAAWVQADPADAVPFLRQPMIEAETQEVAAAAIGHMASNRLTQATAVYPAQYTEDNVEVVQGLGAFAWIQQSITLQPTAPFWAAVASMVEGAVNSQLWGACGAGTYCVNAGDPPYAALPPCYPDIWPVVTGTSSAAQTATVVQAANNGVCPAWIGSPLAATGSTAPMALASALVGQNGAAFPTGSLAAALWLSATESGTVAAGRPWPWTVEDAGFLIRTANLLSGGSDPTLISYVPPTVLAISPAGGTVVNVSGTNFTPGSAVTFGGVPAASVVFLSPGALTVTAPPGTGTVDVVVTTAAGSTPAGALDRFTY